MVLQKSALALICSTHVSHGRVHTLALHLQSPSSAESVCGRTSPRSVMRSLENPLKAFAWILLALCPAAAFNPSASGERCNHMFADVRPNRLHGKLGCCDAFMVATDCDLKAMRVADLKAKLKALSMKVSGTKAELVERLEKHGAAGTSELLSVAAGVNGEEAYSARRPQWLVEAVATRLAVEATRRQASTGVETPEVAVELDSKEASTGGAPSTEEHETTDLCLIDGHGLAYRMHYALQGAGMSTPDGSPSHAVHGFCSKLIDLHDRFPHHRMLVAFDLPGSTFRNDAQSDYKATRPPMPDSLRPQIDAMREACACLDLPAVSVESFEADDVIATCVDNACSSGAASVVIVTTDKDLSQLVTGPDATTQISLWNDQKKHMVDAAAVEAKFGVRPEQMGDLLALMGDSSDNVPGVPGIGAKGAANLLKEHQNLESVLAAAPGMKQSKSSQALIAHAETARRARQVVSLRTDVPLEPIVKRGQHPNFFSTDFDDFLERWELRKVRGKVEQLRRSKQR